MANIKFVDVTGDEESLIIRICNNENQIEGFWFHKKLGIWDCLQEEADKETISQVLNLNEVKRELRKYG